ncbi:MAG: GlsB/YeaQ/YmgE family stress response membrane protein [Hyphomicrobiaceae bacterium]
MSIGVDQIITWAIIGLLGGSLAGLLIRRERRGFGLAANLGVGLAGALIGGFIFRIFGILPALDRISISLRDIVSALAGALLVCLALWWWNQRTRT